MEKSSRAAYEVILRVVDNVRYQLVESESNIDVIVKPLSRTEERRKN